MKQYLEGIILEEFFSWGHAYGAFQITFVKILLKTNYLKSLLVLTLQKMSNTFIMIIILSIQTSENNAMLKYGSAIRIL